jgi:hypothetical protein
MDPIIPSEKDILNAIDKFSTDNNNNKPTVSDSKLNDHQKPSSNNNNKKVQNPNETILTQETIKIFSSMHFDKFKNLPFK